MKAVKWLLVFICVLSFSSLIAQEPKTPAKSPGARAVETRPFKNVGVEEFDKLRAEKTNVVLDVRTPQEFAAGHMPGATNIDWHAPDFEAKVSALDKTKTYLVHCGAGARSAKACEKMGKLNFPSLYNLEGGFKAWERAGKPVGR